MPKKPVVLVWNAGGHVGFATVAALLKNMNRDYTVRAGIFDPLSPYAKKLSDLGAHVFSVDPRRPDTITAALSNVQRMVLVPPGTEADRESLCNAVLSRVTPDYLKFIVTISMFGAQEGGSTYAKQFRNIERMVESTKIPFTHLRCSWYMDNLMDFASLIKRGVLPLPIKEGRIPMVRIKNIGDAATTLIMNWRGHEGRTYDLTGPDNLSGTEIANIFSRVLGISVKFQSPPSDEMYRLMLSCGYPEPRARGFIEMFEIFSRGQTPVTQDLENLLRTGGTKPRKPDNLEKWIKMNPHAFMPVV